MEYQILRVADELSKLSPPLSAAFTGPLTPHIHAACLDDLRQSIAYKFKAIAGLSSTAYSS